MIYIGIGLLLLMSWLMGKADDKRYKRSRDACEAVHAQMYDLIDEHFAGHPAKAKEAKAATDTFIHGVWREAGKDYQPETLKEETTRKEQKKRIKAVKAGTYSRDYGINALEKAELMDRIDRAIAASIAEQSRGPETEADGIQAGTQMLMGYGLSREEARATAENFRKAMTR